MGRLFGMMMVGVIILFFLPVLVLRDHNTDNKKGPRARESSLTIRMYDHKTKEIKTLPLDKYLIGVVAAEMPANFHPEALKAQAIAARTYTVKRLLNKVNRHHPEADMCNDPQHNQAWIDEKTMVAKWNSDYKENYEKIARAVWQTDSQILLYQGEVINPVYHASCGGLGTEDAGEVWSGEVPYLKSTDCDLEKENPRAVATLAVPLEKLEDRLGPGAASIKAGGSRGVKGIEVLSRTSTGRIKAIRFGEVTLDGPEVRQKLGLRSTKFTWRLRGDQLIFETLGNGHGVGLCQYGANYMAQAGYSFKKILTHYYNGVELADYWRYMAGN